MSYIETKNLVEFKSTLTAFNYISKTDLPKHKISICTKNDRKTNVQFNLIITNYSEGDVLQIGKKTIPLTKCPLCVNGVTKKDKPLKIKISSTNPKFAVSVENLHSLYEATDSIKIDKIYVINLSRKMDRRNAMIQKFAEQGITNYEFVDAVDGKTPELLEEFKLRKKSGARFVSSGHYACLKSHTTVLKKVLQGNHENVLILEDDVIFRENFLVNLANIRVPQFDVLYFGGLTKENKLYLNGWAETHDAMGLYAYMVNRLVISKILDVFETCETYCDKMMVEKIQKNNDYRVILLNDMIYTNLDDTDTSNKGAIVYKLIENQMTQL
jgi:GR25 family glycosyltransferase involved in LPS biosynthesis